MDEQTTASGETRDDQNTQKPEQRSAVTGKPAEKPQPALEWAKVIVLPLVTLAVTLVGGHYLTSWLKEREASENNARLYAQLLIQREQSDAQVRKDMFGVVITKFLTDQTPGDWNNKILQLELLANNFNQTLDLAPLFKDTARILPVARGLTKQQIGEMQRRLDVTASNLIFKQVNALAQRGYSQAALVPVTEFAKATGKPWIDAIVPMQKLVPMAGSANKNKNETIRFAVEVLDVRLDLREVEVRLRVDFSDGDEKEEVDRHFWVGLYDFPMLDNTQLPHGLRTSVVLTEFYVADGKNAAERAANSFFNMHLIVFPSGSASYKERQDYDDILRDMLRKRDEELAQMPAGAPRGGSK